MWKSISGFAAAVLTSSACLPFDLTQTEMRWLKGAGEGLREVEVSRNLRKVVRGNLFGDFQCQELDELEPIRSPFRSTSSR